MQLRNQDRFTRSTIFSESKWREIGVFNGVKLFEIGRSGQEILVIASPGGLQAEEGKILELSSLATHSPGGLIISAGIKFD